MRVLPLACSILVSPLLLAGCSAGSESKGKNKAGDAPSAAVEPPDRANEYACESDEDCVLSTLITEEDHGMDMYCCRASTTSAMNKQWEADYSRYCEERPDKTACPKIHAVSSDSNAKAVCLRDLTNHPEGRCWKEQ